MLFKRNHLANVTGLFLTRYLIPHTVMLCPLPNTFSLRCHHVAAEPSCVLWWLLWSRLEVAVPSTAQPLLPPHRGHSTPCHLSPKTSRPDLTNPNFLMFARGQVPIKLQLLRCHTAYRCFQAFQQLELPEQALVFRFLLTSFCSHFDDKVLQGCNGNIHAS